jgi:hypothetical protein
MVVRRGMAVVVVAACSLIGAGTAPAAWRQPVGGPSPINQASDQDAFRPSLANVGGVPYVGWEEHLGNPSEQVHVARLGGGGTAWDKLGATPAYAAGDLAAYASVTGIGSVPWAAWAESDGGNQEIRVASYNGSTWSEPGKDVSATSGGINFSTTKAATVPSLAAVGSVPYVAWLESDTTSSPGTPNNELRVARLHTGTSLPQTYWEEPWANVSPTYGGINESTEAHAGETDLASMAGVPYVAWTEYDGTNSEVRVARLNGAAWQQPWTNVSEASGGINESTTQSAAEPDLASIGGVPYVAWTEIDADGWEVRVARLNGTTWEQPWRDATSAYGGIKQSPAELGYGPSLASIGGVPYVAWSEGAGKPQIRVARLNAATNAWEQVWTGVTGSYGGITDSPTATGMTPSLADIGGVPYVAWEESEGAAHNQTRVSRLEPEFLTQAAGPSTDSATLAAGIRTYGLPYAIGFQYGASALDSETSADPAPTGQDSVSISRQVTGLSPGTGYQFRPFATAGPAPRVFGATATFGTLAAPTVTGGGGDGGGGGIGGGNGASADTTLPIVSAVSANPKVFAVDARGRPEAAVTAKVKHKPRKGTTFSYSLTEPGRAVFSVERVLPGRRVGRACRPASRANRMRRKCIRYALAARFAQPGVAGGNRKRFSGRIGRRRLAPGSYRVTIVAKDAAGNRSKAVRATFTVVRG